VNRLLVTVLIAGAPGLMKARASAGDAKPPEDLSKPVTTVRVGGDPADSAFRDANQKAQARYREATAACNARPSSEQKECMRSAKADLQTAQRVAKAEHDAALRRH
jgi:hypothetical protein